MEVAHHWIDQEHDFSSDEFVETDGDKATWSETPGDLDDRWRRRVKYDLLQFMLDQEERAKEKANNSEEKADDESVTLEEFRERLHKRYRNNKLAIEQYNTVDQLEIYLTDLHSCGQTITTAKLLDDWAEFENVSPFTAKQVVTQLPDDVRDLIDDDPASAA